MSKEEILCLSLWVKKPSKKEIREVVLRWAATETDPDRWTDWARLLAYFMPPPPAKPKTSFEWVAAAVSKHVDAKHSDMECVYCDGQRWLATDSHRAHWATCPEGTTPGLYTHQGEYLGRHTLSVNKGDLAQWFWRGVTDFARQVPCDFLWKVDLGTLRVEEDNGLMLMAMPSEDKILWIDSVFLRGLPDRKVEIATGNTGQAVYVRHGLGEGIIMAVNRSHDS